MRFVKFELFFKVSDVSGEVFIEYIFDPKLLEHIFLFFIVSVIWALSLCLLMIYWFFIRYLMRLHSVLMNLNPFRP